MLSEMREGTVERFPGHAGRALAVVVNVGQEKVCALLVEEQRSLEDARVVRHRHLELAVLGLDHDLAGVDALGTD